MGLPHATSMDLMQGIKDSIQYVYVLTHLFFITQSQTRKATDDLIITFNVKHNKEVMLILYNLLFAGDNPMQAEESSHGRLKCNYLCHTCKAGGTNAEKKI